MCSECSLRLFFSVHFKGRMINIALDCVPKSVWQSQACFSCKALSPKHRIIAKDKDKSPGYFLIVIEFETE